MGNFDSLRPFTVEWVAAQPAIQEMAGRIGVTPLAFAEATIPHPTPPPSEEVKRLSAQVAALQREVGSLKNRPAAVFPTDDANLSNEMRQIRSHLERTLASPESR